MALAAILALRRVMGEIARFGIYVFQVHRYTGQARHCLSIYGGNTISYFPQSLLFTPNELSPDDGLAPELYLQAETQSGIFPSSPFLFLFFSLNCIP